MSKSIFENVDLAPPDKILGLVADFKADPHPNKVSLIVGAYRTEEGAPYVLPVVQKVEKEIADNKTLNHEYLPIGGMPELCRAAVKLALGDESSIITENRIAAVQSLSGTGALRLAFDFLFQHYDNHTVFIPKPTWENHREILKFVGYTDIHEYKYFCSETKGLDLNGFTNDLKSAPPGSVILLHACAQNPCGVDLTQEEWKLAADIVQENNLVVVFDMAYQGFVSGCPDTDAWAVRYFVSRGLEVFICQSFAKNFGLYNERCGNLAVVCKNSTIAMHVESHLLKIIRAMYSNPPNHGAKVVATILNNPVLKREWLDQLKSMTNRILSCRQLLFQKLKELEVPGDWSHVIQQCGMFTYTGLKPDQVSLLREQYHIHMLASGRINVCSINESNLNYVVAAFKDVIINTSGSKL
ncbi:aspartate aminotransferase, cytoplasmic [Hydra vulgaris]|uniref:aspartate transaminase n=1 Tax=Hydra vulgaris TaxID=6087 RepID=T2MHB6_HYDVU|nr:aspartate aminotransferase, cytoplasmic [Hydra vulgaris]